MRSCGNLQMGVVLRAARSADADRVRVVEFLDALANAVVAESHEVVGEASFATLAFLHADILDRREALA